MFKAWAQSKSDDFREYVHRGQHKRAEIASECDFGKSALVQNSAIRAELEELEVSLVSGIFEVVDRAGLLLQRRTSTSTHSSQRQ